MGFDAIPSGAGYLARTRCDLCGEVRSILESAVLVARRGRRVVQGPLGAVYGRLFLVCDAAGCRAWLAAFLRERRVGDHAGPCGPSCPCDWVQLTGEGYLLSLLDGLGPALFTAAARAAGGPGILSAPGPVVRRLAAGPVPAGEEVRA